MRAADDFSYELAGTASADVLARGTCIYERGVRRSFPSDSTLEKQGAEALAGKALFDSSGQPIGLIVALWRHPLDDAAPAAAILRAFAPRAAAELERKRADDHLRHSEQRYRAFIAGSSDAMWRVEFEEPIPIDLPEDEQIDRMYRFGYIAECNDASARIFGAATASDLIGARLGDIEPRNDARVEDMRSVIRSGYRQSSVEVQPLDREGNRTYRIRNLLGIIEKGMLLRAWGTTRDIGDLRKAELEAQASARRFRQILDTILMAAIMLDPEGRVTFCNDYLLKLSGWSSDDLIGRNWFDMMIPEEDRGRQKAAFSKAIAGAGEHHRFEGRLLKRDGTCRLIDWDRAILRDAEGKVTGTASLGRDITDQRALEARLNQTQRLESVGKLAGGIAHDFNNLLTIIRGYTGLLLGAHKSGPLCEAAEEVIRASEQGEALTRQLLSFSRNQPIAPRPLKLNDIVAENENMLRQLIGGNIRLVADLDPSPRTVLADPVQIHQVLVNLALNARDAMPEGGKLTVTSKAVEINEHGAAGMPDVQPGHYVMLVVADTGMGMPEDVKEHLFEPFFTTKPGRGTGLGLASVYGIVRQSGGHISVDSELGKGTTFTILLPEAVQGGPAPKTKGPAAARKSAGTVLLVEDQQALRTLAARTLRTAGYEVLEAAQGKDALSLAGSHLERIDLLLTDLVMPGMDGTELARRLKAARPELKVLYTSGYTEEPPGEAYLQKPFTMRDLAAKVRDLLAPAQ